MLRVRPSATSGRLAVVLAGAAVLVAGCSSPTPTDVPSPATTVAPAPSALPSTSPSASPSTAPTSAPTTAAAQPSAGSDGSVAPKRPVETAAPKKIDEPSKTGVAEVSLASVRSTSIKAASPLDPSGPGVLLRLKLRNTTGKTLDTGFVQVAVTNAAGASGTMLNGRPTRPLAASMKAGASAEGTYAFVLADATSGQVTVQVYVTAGQPVVQFRGRAS